MATKTVNGHKFEAVWDAEKGAHQYHINGVYFDEGTYYETLRREQQAARAALKAQKNAPPRERVPGSGRKAKGAEPRSEPVNARVTPSVHRYLTTFVGNQGDQLEAAIRELVILRHATGQPIPEWFVHSESMGERTMTYNSRGAKVLQAYAAAHPENIIPPAPITPEHPEYPREDWQYEVTNGDTNLGYEDWLQVQIEIAEIDAELGD